MGTNQARPQGWQPTLAVVGATGAVGRVVLDVLPTRHSHWAQVRLAAGSEDVGTVLRVAGKDAVVEALTPQFFDGVDVAIFDIPPGIAREWVELAAARGVEMPIVQQVSRVLAGTMNPRDIAPHLTTDDLPQGE